MFGFSLPKLVVLALILAAVWYGFKAFGRYATGGRGSRRTRVPKNDAGAENDGNMTSVDMTKCAVCGVYVSADGPASCGRQDCPYPNT